VVLAVGLADSRASAATPVDRAALADKEASVVDRVGASEVDRVVALAVDRAEALVVVAEVVVVAVM
jgi:hypothetical protein